MSRKILSAILLVLVILVVIEIVQVYTHESIEELKQQIIDAEANNETICGKGTEERNDVRCYPESFNH